MLSFEVNLQRGSRDCVITAEKMVPQFDILSPLAEFGYYLAESTVRPKILVI